MDCKDMVQAYRESDNARKFEIIYKNYSCFLRMVDSIISGLAYEIESEILFNRRQAKGDLGVRVQTSGILDDCDDPERYITQALVLEDMRRDYSLFTD